MRTIEATPLPQAPAAIPAGHGWRLTPQQLLAMPGERLRDVTT
jgi:hypothetical protein